MSGPRSTARWRRLRAEVLRYATRCAICGEPLRPELRWPHRLSSSVDHIATVQAHPERTFDPTNLRPCHLGCNASRENHRRQGREHPGNRARPSRDW
jgi:5-methylcytosine-specific restriction endonuclease McrA